ncbi:MAG: nucleoside 2-deoxyribosyltransferase [Planctomycetota bacterium]
MKRPSFFIAGIIQGSIAETRVHSQDYRRQIKEIVEQHIEGALVYCPFENHPNSLEYDQQTASRVFFDHIAMVARSDCLITYLPEASMGTAVEMYAAHLAGKPVVTISPLSGNWTIRFLSNRLLADIDEFGDFVASGELLEFLGGRREHRPQRQNC